MMGYRMTFGRNDGKTQKSLNFYSRQRCLKFANHLAFVFFDKHPFQSSSFEQYQREEGEGFFVEVKLQDISGSEAH
jgi:hypothetical protein